MDDYFQELREIDSWVQRHHKSGAQTLYIGWAYLVNRELMEMWEKGCAEPSRLEELCDRILEFDQSLEQDFNFEDRDYHYDARSWRSIEPRKVFKLCERLPELDWVVPLARGATPAGILVAQYKGCGLKPMLLSRHKLGMEVPCPEHLDLEGRVLVLDEDHNSGSGGTLKLATEFVSADQVMTGSVVTHYLASRVDCFAEREYD